jgi:hypothetical protein
MKTWNVEFYSGAKMQIKATDYFSAKARVDAIIKSCNNKPKLFSLALAS